jgi:Ni,Fe-hydrogenase III large subunit
VCVERARTIGLRGPAARASGLAEDARAEDPLYRELGFAPSVRQEGDARARMLLHVDELGAALALAATALSRAQAHEDAPIATPAATVTLEGPRGPLHVHPSQGQWQLSAPGEHAARIVAGDAAVGLEWAAALVALASFDLSPWRVGA